MSLTIGIDVGGTKLLGGVVDAEGNVLTHIRSETPREGGRKLTQRIADLAKELIADHSIQAVGLSAAGFVSSDRKTMLAAPNIADWNGVNLDKELQELIGLPVIIENDANAAAWGEAKFGAGKNQDHVMLLTIGTGIGGGLVVNGELHRGAFGVAAEFGHLRVVPEGHLCGCGARGCLEAEASGTAIAAYTGRPAAEATAEVIERTGRLVGRAVATVANLLDLRLAVVAGSVALGFGGPFFAAANDEIGLCARLDFSKGCELRRGGLGADGPLIGAAAVGWRGLDQ